MPLKRFDSLKKSPILLEAIDHMNYHSGYMTKNSYQAVIDSLIDVLVVACEESESNTTSFYMDTLDTSNEAEE